MNHRFLALMCSLAIVAAILSIAPAPAAGQTSGSKVAPSGQRWTPARTPDGQPDLQGVWTDPTITPFERPGELAAKEFLTEQEAAAYERQLSQEGDRDRRDGSAEADLGRAYNEFWFDRGTKVVSTRRTSLVVDPPDGRVPVTHEAEAKRDYNLEHNAESWEYMSPWDRCITRGVPGGMFPAGYNNAYRILQIPGYVVIFYEMIHDARIIPLDGRPHVASNIRLWNGDSRGRWEGNTLVVDTTNFNGKGWIATNAAAGRIRGIAQSEAAHVVERFTRVDADTISYEVSINDPNVYTKPWKVAIPLSREQDYQIYEYACHEGNRAVENILSGGRALDKAAEGGAKK